MITVHRDTTIFIISSNSYFTGGTLLLHQLGAWLNAHGFAVNMLYPQAGDDSIHPEFLKFNLDHTQEISDDEKDLLIVPESDPFELKKYKKVRKVLWWLSVDNYFRSFNNASIKRQLFNKLMGHLGLYKKADFHLCQSQYAIDFLADKGIKGTMLSDYLHDKFIKEDITFPEKQNKVLYNPKKGQEFTQRLINAAPDITWKPLINMTPEEVFDAMLSSKVYIDFGFHPGKDRFPREAAICGCNIITGKQGAAANSIDVPIPTSYKFEENNLQPILDKIRNVFENFVNCQKELEDYRKKIKGEKAVFEQQAAHIFSSKTN